MTRKATRGDAPKGTRGDAPKGTREGVPAERRGLLPQLRSELLVWYDAHARDLPWRRTRDPYAIWISEVMLQQTRVETVIPYYQRFLARFPSVQALADAPSDAVLAAWSGLGYYRRARMLHGAAQKMAKDHEAAVPRDAGERRGLPGVGRYTAGAIGSIAFDLPEPIVDGNVARVLSRMFCIDTPLGSQVTERVLWELAEALVLGERPGALNQALMELGATVCTPDNARCGSCPWRAECRARAEERVDELPIPAKAKAPRTVRLSALVAQRSDGSVWLTRSEDSLFHGLWGVPSAPGHTPEELAALCESLDFSGAKPVRLGRVKHVLTHRVLDVQVYALAVERTKSAALRAVARDAFDSLGISRLTHKLLAEFDAHVHDKPSKAASKGTPAKRLKSHSSKK